MSRSFQVSEDDCYLETEISRSYHPYLIISKSSLEAQRFHRILAKSVCLQATFWLNLLNSKFNTHLLVYLLKTIVQTNEEVAQEWKSFLKVSNPSSSLLLYGRYFKDVLNEVGIGNQIISTAKAMINEEINNASTISSLDSENEASIREESHDVIHLEQFDRFNFIEDQEETNSSPQKSLERKELKLFCNKRIWSVLFGLFLAISLILLNALSCGIYLRLVSYNTSYIESLDVVELLNIGISDMMKVSSKYVDLSFYNNKTQMVMIAEEISSLLVKIKQEIPIMFVKLEALPDFSFLSEKSDVKIQNQTVSMNLYKSLLNMQNLDLIDGIFDKNKSTLVKDNLISLSFNYHEKITESIFYGLKRTNHSENIDLLQIFLNLAVIFCFILTIISILTSYQSKRQCLKGLKLVPKKEISKFYEKCKKFLTNINIGIETCVVTLEKNNLVCSFTPKLLKNQQLEGRNLCLFENKDFRIEIKSHKRNSAIKRIFKYLFYPIVFVVLIAALIHTTQNQFKLAHNFFQKSEIIMKQAQLTFSLSSYLRIFFIFEKQFVLKNSVLFTLDETKMISSLNDKIKETACQILLLKDETEEFFPKKYDSFNQIQKLCQIHNFPIDYFLNNSTKLADKNRFFRQIIEEVNPNFSNPTIPVSEKEFRKDILSIQFSDTNISLSSQLDIRFHDSFSNIFNSILNLKHKISQNFLETYLKLSKHYTFLVLTICLIIPLLLLNLIYEVEIQIMSIKEAYETSLQRKSFLEIYNPFSIWSLISIYIRALLFAIFGFTYFIILLL